MIDIRGRAADGSIEEVVEGYALLRLSLFLTNVKGLEEFFVT